jgi:shikimate dehydrogenase
MAKFGLIGKNIGYSFSKRFFTEKFEKENKRHTYENFDIDSLEEFKKLLENNPDLKGLNVTIPYKESIILYLNRLDSIAEKIGAVNTIKILKDGTLKGFNTDYFGFAKAFSSLLPIKEKTALVLGTGGASKAIIYVLDTMGYKILQVSRFKNEHTITYDELSPQIIATHYLIINTTPLGTYPNIEKAPNIPYTLLTPNHILFDLTYNPSQTTFMKLGLLQRAKVSNGLKMLEYQALKSWEIWQK